MDIEKDLATFGPYFATLIYNILSGFIPILNAEIFLVATANWVPKGTNLYLLSACAAAGQMISKSGLYLLTHKTSQTRFIKKLKGKRFQLLMSKVQNNPTKVSGLVFVSSSVGFPPFLALTVVCGMLKTGLTKFTVIGFLGMLARFLPLVLLPGFVKSLMNN